MKKKVTLRELLAEQIVIALLIAVYYWMWARRDWQDWYVVFQSCVSWFAVIFFGLMAVRVWQYKKEKQDELSIQNLRRSDAICMTIVVVGMIALAFAGAVEAVSGIVMGYLLVGLLVVLAVVRTVAFSVMDLKGV